ncbi:MAG: T9SS type A sorting domain-containing protein [Bacteroidales bacterium]|nr:T9SS type A sorting domain-containing protein [Bacteroidales bacterium]
MKLFALLLLTGFLFHSFNSAAQVVVLNQDETKIEITENTYTHLGLKNTISQINAFEVKASQGDFSQIRIDGYGYSTKIGEPKLPVIKKLIEIPLQSQFNINIIFDSYKDYMLSDLGIVNPIIPVQPSLSKSDDPESLEFEINSSVYATDAFLGNDLVQIIPLGIMRGVNIARVEISPVQYNPVKNIVRIYENLEVSIQFTGANVPETIQFKDAKTNRYFKSVSRMFFNYKNSPSDELFGDTPITYIIVSDPMFQESLQPFIQWKTKKGFKVVEAYTNDPGVGTTTSSIKSYLEGFYNNPPEGYNPQTFVLFVGDVAQIPTFSGNAGGHVTDLYYCEYTSDFFPEAYYGRFSATNLSQLQAQIDKTLEYEQYTFPDPSFLDEVVMVAGADASHQSTWGNGQINYGTTYYFNEDHGLTSHTYLQPEPGGGNYSQNIKQNISDGVSYANYTAHCSPSGWADPNFVISDVSGLTNAHKYPLMVGNCCSSVEFQTDCLGEEVLRAPLKGALGYIGGSNSTYWDEDYWWGVGFETVSANPTYNPAHLGAYDRTFHDQQGIALDDWYITQGQMPSAGNLAVTQAGSSLEEYYWEIYHLMGDPSLMIYFSQPPQTNTSFAGLMPVGSATFTVNTDPYAYVAISKEGVLYGTAMADGDGVAEVVFETLITVPGVADVVVTGQNLMPFMGEVTVASPDGAYVLLGAFEVNDSNGNQNGMADYGETFSLDITMKNLGSTAAQSVELTLASEDEYVTINVATANLGNINPDEIISLSDVFDLTFAEDIPDEHIVGFTLEANDGTDFWLSGLAIQGHAPFLIYSGMTILDPTGNNNGKLDPGETVEILIGIMNNGSAEAYDVSGTLTSLSAFVTVNTTEPQVYGDIDPEGDALASFEVTADESTPAGQVAMFNVDFEGDMGITGAGEFSIVVGQIPVIIVDLDENNSSAPMILADVEEMGVAAELSTALPADLNLYSSVFVCLGIYSSNYQLSSADGSALAEYLDNGGNLYMEGGDTWYYDDQTAVHTMFGINGSSDGSGDLGTINGVAGTMTEGMTFNYTGENNWIDHLEATGTGELILNNASPAYGCAVANDASGYNTIGASFEYGGLEETSRVVLIEKYLEFFNIIGSNAMSCVMTADPTEICRGELSQLNAQVFGGSGNYSYLWSPADGLSNPAIANPVASPEVSTMYSLTITDMISGDELLDEMFLEVMETPETPAISQVGENLVSSTQFGNQWYSDNGSITGATGQIYSPSASGNYYTIVTNNFGCASEMSNVLYFQPTFINELTEQGSLRVYPNPARGEVNVDFLVEEGDFVTISILNTFGQTIYQENVKDLSRLGINTFTVDLSLFSGGVYYVKLQDAGKSITKKILLSN